LSNIPYPKGGIHVKHTSTNEHRTACPVCGIQLLEHLGVIGTCARLQKAIAVLQTIADPGADVELNGRSLDRFYEDIALEALTELGVVDNK
jgi:hypothetical protein